MDLGHCYSLSRWENICQKHGTEPKKVVDIIAVGFNKFVEKLTYIPGHGFPCIILKVRIFTTASL